MTKAMMMGASLALMMAVTQAWGAEAQVTIDDFTFSPPKLTIPAGTQVTWTNHDDIPHKVVSSDDPKLMNSPVMDTDDHFSKVFDRPGIYAYFCSLHPHMQGQIVVQ